MDPDKLVKKYKNVGPAAMPKPDPRNQTFLKNHRVAHWLPQYVADAISASHEGEWLYSGDYTTARSVWKKSKELSDHRRDSIKVLYYKNNKALMKNDQAVMIPDRFMTPSLKWGSLAIASYPGSDIYMYLRGPIEEFINRADRKLFLRSRKSHFAEKDFKYWIIPSSKLKVIVIPGISIEKYETISEHHLKDIPR